MVQHPASVHCTEFEPVQKVAFGRVMKFMEDLKYQRVGTRDQNRSFKNQIIFLTLKAIETKQTRGAI